MNIERRFGFLDQKDINFMFQGDLLEVHWKVIEQFLAVSFDMDRIWDRSRQVCINGREIRTISPEDMIILLCFHGHKHGWQSLGWLADLVYTISNNPELPWNDLLVFAETLGLRRIVLTGLFLAHQYGGIDFRPDIENLVTTDKKVQNLAREIQYSMFLCRELAIGQIFYLKSRERLMDKARFLGYYPANRLLVFVRWVIRPFTNRQIPSKKDQKNPDTI